MKNSSKNRDLYFLTLLDSVHLNKLNQVTGTSTYLFWIGS